MKNSMRAVLLALVASTAIVAGPIAATTSTAAPAVERAETKLECKPIMVYGLRGSGQASGKGTAGYGPQLERIAVLTARAIQQQAENENVPVPTFNYYASSYPAVDAKYAVTDSAKYYASVQEGADKTLGAVLKINQDCPKSRIMLAGYSQGAQALHLAMTYIGESKYNTVRPLIRGVLLLADPTRNRKEGAGVYIHDLQLNAEDNAPKNGVLYESNQRSIPAGLNYRVVSSCFVDDAICNEDGKDGALESSKWTNGDHTESYKADSIVSAVKTAVAYRFSKNYGKN